MCIKWQHCPWHKICNPRQPVLWKPSSSRLNSFTIHKDSSVLCKPLAVINFTNHIEVCVGAHHYRDVLVPYPYPLTINIHDKTVEFRLNFVSNTVRIWRIENVFSSQNHQLFLNSSRFLFYYNEPFYVPYIMILPPYRKVLKHRLTNT